MLPYFQEDFLNNVNIDTLRKLLNEGIFTTAMLRNLCNAIFYKEPSYKLRTRILPNNQIQLSLIPTISKSLVPVLPFSPQSQIFDSIFIDMVRTVQHPGIRYAVVPQALNNNHPIAFLGEFINKMNDYYYDVLSPPHILEPTDSMGNYKKSTEELEVAEYGEAIVEIRNPRVLRPWFKYKNTKKIDKNIMEAEKRFGNLFTQPHYLKDDAMILFTFLEKFASIDIDILLREQAKDAYELHCKYPINANLPQEEKIQNLSKLREKSPGSLVVQTLRLGRLIDDSLHRLAFNRESHYEITIKKQDELFCPQYVFSFLLKKVASRTVRESKNGLHIISK